MPEYTSLEQLYIEVCRLCAEFAVYKKSVLENTRDLFPQIQAVSEEILGTQDLGLDREEDQLVRQLLIHILEDLVHAMTNRDEILLEDTLEYGLLEFLEMFISSEDRLQELKEESAREHL